MNEEWRDVKGYEGLYRVSNLGRVYSLRRHTFMVTENLESHSCVIVRLFKDGYLRKASLARIMMEAFKPEEAARKRIVKHKDGNFRNNSLDNLEFLKKNKVKREMAKRETVTRETAKKHRGKAVYCVELDRTFFSGVEAEKITGVDKCTISSCCRKRPHYHTAGGYHWRFADEVKTREEGNADLYSENIIR